MPRVSSIIRMSSSISRSERTTTGARWRMLSSCIASSRRIRAYELAQEVKRRAQDAAAETGAAGRSLDEMRGMWRDPVSQGAREKSLDLHQVLLPFPHLRPVLSEAPARRGLVR